MKTYIAQKTISLTEGQAIADIIKGEKYEGDKENEYVIGQFGNTIYITQEQFDTLFKADERKSHRKATTKYFKDNIKVVYLRLFPTDNDIIDHLAKIKEPTRTNPNRNGQSEYIRKLIRADIERQKNQQ